LVSLTTLRAIKLTPTLVARFATLPLRKVKNPCLYCPGICLTACPTFTHSGSLALSPLGYARDRKLGVERCVKCWRCVGECPLHFPLPETYCDTPVKLSAQILKEGKPLLVASGRLESELGAKLAERYGLGLAVVSGVEERYDLGKPLEPKSLTETLKKLRPYEPLALSPEVAHALGIPFVLERPELFGQVSFTGKVHLPCLLRSRREGLLKSLERLGVNATLLDAETCVKVSVDSETLYLCPKASSQKVKTIFEMLL